MINYTFVVKQLMTEMFKRVGLKYDEEYCKKEDWFRTRSWTVAEQENFKRWGEGVLKSALKMTDYAAAREMGWFLLTFGWTTRFPDENKD